MSFTPLGSFDPNAPIDPKYVQFARDYADSLESVPDGLIVAGYMHWTVGHYDQDFTDYNGSIYYNPDSQLFFFHTPTSPANNAMGYNDKPEASHTWLRNTGAVGISTDDMVGASTHDFGPEPLTIATLWHLCTSVAAMSKKYNLDIQGTINSSKYANGAYNGEKVWKTHAEAAVLGGNPPVSGWYNYGPSGTCERWDLSTFVALPEGLTVGDSMATACGNALRLLSHRIKVLM